MILKNFKYINWVKKVGDFLELKVDYEFVSIKLIREVMSYLRIDSCGDKEWDLQIESEIEMLILSAETFLKSHGVKKDYKNELYKIAIFMLVSIWYDNRGLQEQGVREIPFGVNRIIKQLNMLNDYGTI